jgi:hypothetical protein
VAINNQGPSVHVQTTCIFDGHGERKTKHFFINRPFVDKNGLSYNKYTSKNLLPSIFTLADFAKIPKK